MSNPSIETVGPGGSARFKTDRLDLMEIDVVLSSAHCQIFDVLVYLCSAIALLAVDNG